jgi:hypothetical protein
LIYVNVGQFREKCSKDVFNKLDPGTLWTKVVSWKTEHFITTALKTSTPIFNDGLVFTSGLFVSTQFSAKTFEEIKM